MEASARPINASKSRTISIVCAYAIRNSSSTARSVGDRKPAGESDMEVLLELASPDVGV
jgi:hypothetical protein